MCYFSRMKQRIPALLQAGDTIALSATARFATQEMIDTAKSFIEAAGFRCYYEPAILAQQGQVAGSISQRIESFNNLVYNDKVKAIWNIRGGYGSAEIVDLVDWNALWASPKWLIGFSDFTTFLTHAHQKGLAGLHAPMPVSFESTDRDDMSAVFAALRSGRLTYSLNSGVSGISGTLLGGNLSVLYSIYGTPSLPSLSGSILFLEDLDEYHYHLDRMLLALARKGAFEGLQAVLLGTFSDIHEHDTPWGNDVRFTLRRYFETLGIPVIEGFAVGHAARNVPVFTGVDARIAGGVLEVNLTQ